MLKDIVNPLLFGPINEKEVGKVANTIPKYSIGEIVDLETWGGGKYNFKIEDIKVTYHNRLNEWVWGYKLYKENEQTGFNFEYIPEKYLRKKEQNKNRKR